MALSTSTKSQVWSIDLIIGILIFTAAILLFFKYGIAMLDSKDETFNDIRLDAEVISGYLISSGYPINWTKENVTLIGLTDGNMDINPLKVANFSAIASLDYGSSKRLLATSNDFNVFFLDKSNNTVRVEGVKSIGKNYSTENYGNMVKIVRFVSYNGSIIEMVLYVW